MWEIGPIIDLYLWNNLHNNTEVTLVMAAAPVPEPLHRNRGSTEESRA